MEKIPSQQYHIDIPLFRQTHDFVETFPTVVSADGVALVVANVVVGRDQDADCVCGLRGFLSFWGQLESIQETNSQGRQYNLLCWTYRLRQAF